MRQAQERRSRANHYEDSRKGRGRHLEGNALR